MTGVNGRTAARLALGVAALGWPLLASAGVAAAPATGSLEGVPRVQHVVTLILENEDYATTWSATGAAKYLNSLVARGAFVPNYFATGHVSLDNYISLTSGVAGPQIGPTYTDCLGLSLWACVQDVSAATTVSGNVADQVEGAGLTWKQYSDGTSAPCVHDTYAPTAGPDAFQGDKTAPESSTAGPNYADRHVGFLYYTDIIGDQARCDAHLRPFTELQGDLAHDSLPAYSFITPDTCNDGHDNPTCADGSTGGLARADKFLIANLPQLLAYLQAHDGVLFITMDEGSTSSASSLSGCCHGGPGGQVGFGGQVGLLALGPMVAAGRSVTTQYDHASLLRTEEDLLGINTYINNAASSSPMADIWTSANVAGVQTQTTSSSSSSSGGAPPTVASVPNTSAGAPGAGAGAVALLAVGAGAVLVRTRRRRV